MDTSRALLVGIDNYRANGDLDGCVNDVQALDAVLRKNWDGSPNFRTVSLLGHSGIGGDGDLILTEVNRVHLRKALERLFKPDDATSFRLFYFAGHGVLDSGELWLRTTDGDEDAPGFRFSQLAPLINSLASADGEVLVILDCCFSGAASNLTSDSQLTRPGVSVITSARATEEAAETTDGRGIFSTYLEEALSGGASDIRGNVTTAGVYAYLTEAFDTYDQRPTLKADVQRLRPIRQCQPVVKAEVLRELPTWFPTPTSQYALDPSYEPTEQPHDTTHQEIFQKLQSCVAAHLVVPVGESHMYYAALNSTGCELTPLGRRYLRLAQAELI